MSQHTLQRPIEELWERRDTLSSATGGEARQSVEAALDALDSGAARVAEPTPGGWQVNQWLKKAVLLSFRLTDSAPMEGPGGAPVFDKVPLKFAGWGAEPLPRCGFPRRPRRGGASLGLYRPGRGADAELRQRRRLCRAQHHGRHLGDGRQLRADRRQLPPVGRRRHRRRAGAAAGQSGDHRGRLLRRRALRGGRGRGGRARQRAVDGRVHRRLDQGRRSRHRRDPCRPRAVLFGRRAWHAAWPPLPDGSPGPSLYCAVIVKTVDEQTRAKTSINELLRD